MPVRLLAAMRSGELRWDDWLRSAPNYGLDGVEIYHRLLESRDEKYLKCIKEILDRLNLKISLLTCSPDFAHPDVTVRKKYLEEMKANIRAAKFLNAFGVRVTTGTWHPVVKIDDGLEWVTECLTALTNYAEKMGIILALENHYRDKYWKWPDFAHRSEIFLKVFHRIENTSIKINFDASNQLMIEEDPIALLTQVKEKVVSVHASDRFPRSYQHSVIGEGSVDFDAIFRLLREVGFSGWISIEDGNPYGEKGFEKSIFFLKNKIKKYWS